MRNAPDRLRLALVAPRYAAGMAGGAETLIQQWAEKLSRRGHDIEVLTTCAKDHFTWENHFPPGPDRVGGVRVNRFPVDPRDTAWHSRLQGLISLGGDLSFEEEEAWLDNGVTSDRLCGYLDRNRSRFDAVVFAPYLFGLTYRGIETIPEKAVLVPCLHDESFAYLETTKRSFRSARAVFFNTPGEKELAESLFNLREEKTAVVGLGVEPPPRIVPEDFPAPFTPPRPFLLYAGRREGGKNTPLLIEYFRLFHNLHKPELGLVLAGSGPVSIPEPARGFIIDAGYLSEQGKWNAYGAAWAFCQPSTNESFSIVLLESWLAGKPALVNAACPVTRAHCRLGGGGLWFRDYPEFEEALFYLLEDRGRAERMGASGRDYVLKNYNWETILERLETALGRIRG